MIRVHAREYASIGGGRFAHFNLAVANHEVGSGYCLPRITRPGTDPGTPPLLDFREIWIGECIEFVPRIAIDDVPDRFFAISMRHVRDADSLREVIWERYSRSRPRLTRAGMHCTGVSVTVLDLEGPVSL